MEQKDLHLYGNYIAKLELFLKPTVAYSVKLCVGAINSNFLQKKTETKKSDQKYKMAKTVEFC